MAGGLGLAAHVFNAAWFGMGFRFFSLKSTAAARLIRPDIPAGDPRTRLVVPSMKFLGGFNLALAVLALIRLWRTFGAKRPRPPEIRGEQDVEAFIVSGIAHATQFSYNLPHIRGRAKGAPWDVLRGIMLVIFVTDGLGAALNFAAAVMAVVRWRRDKGVPRYGER